MSIKGVTCNVTNTEFEKLYVACFGLSYLIDLPWVKQKKAVFIRARPNDH